MRLPSSPLDLYHMRTGLKRKVARQLAVEVTEGPFGERMTQHHDIVLGRKFVVGPGFSLSG